MDTVTKRIDPEFLFPVIKEQLAEGREVSFTVTGKSMWPFIINDRDSVIIRTCDPDSLRIGDIVLFQTHLGNYMLHRINAIKPDTFETTGDGNLFRDGWFSKDCIIGQAVSIIRKGKKIDCNHPWWRFLFLTWMYLFPIRPVLIRMTILAVRIKNRLKHK